MAIPSADHYFGGDWTELKLEAISAYSEFFTGAIGSRFDLWYIDPFAGTGQRSARVADGGLFEDRPISTVEKTYPGSAARALSVEPPFNHFRFGDTKKKHIVALDALRDLHPNRDIKVIPGDANTFIQEGFAHRFWSDPAGKGRVFESIGFPRSIWTRGAMEHTQGLG